MPLSKYSNGIWLIDFEFHPERGVEGNRPHPVCLVAREFVTGTTKRYWRDELKQMSRAPFPTDEKSLCVAYFASAEIDCFLSLGWPKPANVLDLYVEFRNMTNGAFLSFGSGLIGAMQYFGLPSIESEQKTQMRDLILARGPWSTKEQVDILNYCETDVVALSNLLPRMLPHIHIPRALLRGGYMKAVSSMQDTGVPIDTETLNLLTAHWDGIQDHLIADIDKDYGVFDGRTFKRDRWETYLISQSIPWPRLESGALDLSDNTFRQQSRIHPCVAPMRELRAALSDLRLNGLKVGDDKRNRCLLSPFCAKTSRNQPSNSAFIFGPSVWLRGLIKPEPGYGLAYIDWSQQEFGIAAALSDDEVMKQAYLSGDPYLAFAKQAGSVPQTATKATHKAEREQFKQCVLAVQYGMGEESLAAKINQPVARARQLLSLHKQTYKTFWRWSDSAVDEALLNGRLWSVFDWQILVGQNINARSLRNFPMQANGAEMLRIACILLVEADIRVCAPVHDALLIEAPLEQMDQTVAEAQAIMQKASNIVLNGFELGSDAKLVIYPDRYMDERGVRMWEAVNAIIRDKLSPLAPSQ